MRIFFADGCLVGNGFIKFAFNSHTMFQLKKLEAKYFQVIFENRFQAIKLNGLIYKIFFNMSAYEQSWSVSESL